MRPAEGPIACILATLFATSAGALAQSAAPAAPTAAEEVPRSTAQAVFTHKGELTQGGWIRGRVPDGTVSALLDDQRLALDNRGNYFAAFDRDAAGEATLRASLADGREVIETLVIAPRKWTLEYVDAAKRPGGATSEAFWKIREPEYNRIVAARDAGSDSDGWKQDFIWPVKGRISGRFGSQRIYRGEPGIYHSGLDIAPGAGVPFVAPADGVVTLAAHEPFSLEGHLIIVDHGQGLNSAFLHAATIDVVEGQVVKQGQRLGTVGMSGRASGPHLHWSLKWHDARLDPLLFLGPMH